MSSREHPKHDQAEALAVSRDDEKSIFDSRLALLRWTRIEGLYGGHRCHKDYVAWLRAHLVRIAILVPAQPAGLLDFSGVPEVGATEVGSDKSPADARSRVKPRKFRLPTLRWNKQAARPNRQGTDDAGGLQIPTEHDKDHGGISRDDQGG